MERTKDECTAEKSRPSTEFDEEVPSVSSNLYLDQVGEVVLNLNSDGLSWKLVETMDNDMDGSTCFGINLTSKTESEIKFSDVYAVEFISWGLIREANIPNAGGCILGCDSEVTVTKKAGHAFDVMSSITDEELNSYDGVVAVGGDGFFNEILNGLLSSRHKVPYPPAPTDFVHLSGKNGTVFVHDANGNAPATSFQNDHQDTFLDSSGATISGLPTCRNKSGSCNTESADQAPTFTFPNEHFRLGIIPAGSTDAIAVCTTGARDPVTSALQIILGKRVCLDIAQVVRWRTTTSSKDAPYIRYAASFAGYGFFGDVIKESEDYRWMGPKRYDYAGAKVFLKHRSYEAEIRFLEAKAENENQTNKKDLQGSEKQSLWNPQKKSRRLVCSVNCSVCSECLKPIQAPSKDPIITGYTSSEEVKWLQCKGRFLSVGAAVISCRNERAPDGLVADAHLADGFLHLVLIKECPRALFLWHLTQVARKGGDPLNFEFVEHHKTRAFTFTSFGDTSVWNLDGELFEAHQLSVQVIQGLISLFASGPEV
ncbi:PREDICTED: ceramide kinase-like isoform X2 [Nelumbo nucifera]|uniref:Ceramide kinase-like isoform X2 n=2 Tax=Nelumbo nucifera TaxID=4432 RepID=A0A1U7ZWG1_NELNU|nr:PREDICTED: ceramide kinase-like isoform X2 [Nelumbo nucifera]DAD47708.1 TPA_asm: hypothetical protein HUJ06_017645 [Nelumbo nucifera]